MKVITEVPVTTDMESGIGSEVCQALLFGLELSSMGMEGGFKAGLLQQSGKGFSEQS